MKKVVLALAVVFSVALVSCSNDSKKAEDSVAADTAVEAVAEEDTTKADTAAQVAEEAPAADTAAKAEEAK